MVAYLYGKGTPHAGPDVLVADKCVPRDFMREIVLQEVVLGEAVASVADGRVQGRGDTAALAGWKERGGRGGEEKNRNEHAGDANGRGQRGTRSVPCGSALSGSSGSASDCGTTDDLPPRPPEQPPEQPPSDPTAPSGKGRDRTLCRAEFGPTATVWLQGGTSFLVPIGAPSPEAFRPSMDEARLTRRLEEKRRERERGIEQAFELLRERGLPLDRTLAMITYDCELAPITTNREQLEAIGVHVPSSDCVIEDQRTMTYTLWSIVYGLARLGIYLSGTDHLDDRELVHRLVTRILNDEVRDIAPNGDMAEFIDLCDPSKGLAAAHALGDLPDGLTGPFETSAELEEGEEAPFVRPTPKRRDHLLPRPTRESWTISSNRMS